MTTASGKHICMFAPKQVYEDGNRCDETASAQGQGRLTSWAARAS